MIFNEEVEDTQGAFMKSKKKKMTYVDIIVILCLKFMEGKDLESVSRGFHLENQALNAASCEFLELLITRVEDAHVSMLLCKYLLTPLLQ